MIMTEDMSVRRGILIIHHRGHRDHRERIGFHKTILLIPSFKTLVLKSKVNPVPILESFM
jgi:hypothetical protein